MLTPDELRDLYPSGPYIQTLSYSPLSAEYLGVARKAVGKLSSKDSELFDDNGFVVLGRARPSYGQVYEDAFHAHSPIVITTDSLLYAFHDSYDQLLEELEIHVASVALEDMLRATGDELRRLEIADGLEPARQDLLAYVATAQALLAGKSGPYTETVMAKSPARLRVIGETPHEIDFSIFTPRGHYTHSEQLERYFYAVQWIQQVPFRYVLDDGSLDRRAIDATMLLARILDTPDVQKQWTALDEILGLLIGPQDDFSIVKWGQHFAEQRGDLAAYVGLTDKALLARAKQIEHEPSIASGLIKGELPEVANTKQVFWMGARYAADSEVLSEVSYDRLEHPTTKAATRRMKPSEMDVQFALGANVALELLAGDIDAFQYQGRLRQLRFSLDQLGPKFWGSSVYNRWVDALRSLSFAPEKPDNLPEAMRTHAWDLKMLNTKLASWAELRHDNILYVKQSYSAMPICDYPDAYLEPYPDFYERMSLLHAKLYGVVAAADWPNKKKAQRFLERGRDIHAALAHIAHKEVQHQALDDKERVFLKRIIDSKFVEENVVCTVIKKRVSWDGWYTELFYGDPEDAFKYESVIADVHTTPADQNGDRIGWVLHGATSHPHAMLLTIDNHRGDARAYVGPVSRFHRVETLDFQRMTDEQWRKTSKPEPAPWQREFLP